MSLMHKTIEQILEQDLILLRDSEAQESRVLEYKKILPLDQDESKKEFLADVSSFANLGGGDILFGIEATNGRITSIPGLEIDDPDKTILKYENLIRNGIQPRIFGLQSQVIHLENGKQVLIIRIPRSFNSPHMVTFKNSSRFFTRNSAGKHPMDITEIRSSFLSTSGLTERIRDFRLDRYSRIRENQGNILLENNPHYIVLHLIPLDAWNNHQYDISLLEKQVRNTAPFYDSYDHRYNLDGYVTFSKFASIPLPHSYAQFFRTGIVELVDAYMLHIRDEDQAKIFYYTQFEKKILQYSFRYLEALRILGVSYPIVISLALLGAQGFNFNISSFYSPDHTGLITDDILLPEIIIESHTGDQRKFSKLFKPIFDTLWNAFGWPNSLNYDQNGEWNPREY